MFHQPTYTFTQINEILKGATDCLKGIVEGILANEPQEPISFTIPFPEANFYYTLNKSCKKHYDYIHIHKYDKNTNKEIGNMVSVAIVNDMDAITDILYHIQTDTIISLCGIDN